MSLYEIIKSLQQAKGTLAKQALLDANTKNFLLRDFLKATYDPGISYYMKKAPRVAPGNLATMDQETVDWLVDKIAGRFYTGHAAEFALKQMLSSMDAEGQELVQLILDRKIGASVGDTMVLKAFPGLYFVPPYQRCSLLDAKTRKKFLGKKFYVQTKLDGSFAYVVKWPDGRAEVITRQGNKYPQAFAEKLAFGLKPGSVIVGELEVYRGYHDERQLLDRKTGNGVLNSALQGGEVELGLQVQCTAWDLLTTDEFTAGKSMRPYSERLDYLRDYEIPKLHQGQIVLVQTWTVNSLEEAFAIYRDHTSRGLEGCIIKLFDSMWKDGTATDMLKLKLKFEVDMRVTGIYEGEGKAKGMLGGVNMQSEDGLLANNCGSGFSDPQRKEYWENPDLILNRVVAVEANDITIRREAGSKPALSLPIFIEVRATDKTVADTYERIVEQHEAAKLGA